MKFLKLILRYLPVLAIIFVTIYFLNLDISFTQISLNIFLGFCSLILLLLVFLIRGYIWHRLLKRFHIDVNFGISLESQFKTVYYKYIPGKIWILLGKANIISQQGYSLKKCIIISTFSQIISVTSGLLVGITGWLLIIKNGALPITLLITVSVIILLFFFVKERKIPVIKSKLLPGKLKEISGTTIPPVVDIFVLFIIQWIILGFSYLIFFKAIGYDLNYYVTLIQPLANNMGIITLIAPGGLGIREGFMVGYLIMLDLGINQATSLSILSRLWFFIVETLIFILGYGLYVSNKKNM